MWFLLYTIGLNIFSAFVLCNIFPALSVFVWIFIPCRDKQFGNGKKYYWVRQTVFALGTLVTLLIGIR